MKERYTLIRKRTVSKKVAVEIVALGAILALMALATFIAFSFQCWLCWESHPTWSWTRCVQPW